MKYILSLILFFSTLIAKSQNIVNNENSLNITVHTGMAYFVKGDEATTRCLDAYWICKIIYIKDEDKDKDPNSSVASNNNGRLSIKFNLNSYSKEEQDKYFNNEFFIMENENNDDEFILPEFLVDKLNLNIKTIPKGKYPIIREENSNFVIVNF